MNDEPNPHGPAGTTPGADTAHAPDLHEADARDALAALATDEGAREVEDPDPATLTSPSPQLEDIPDDLPHPAAPEPAGAQGADAPGSAASPRPLPPHAFDDGPVEHRDDAPGSADAETTAEIDRIELAALMVEGANPSQTMPFAPVQQATPPRAATTERISGAAKATGSLAWGSRTDVGCIRSHNEDSFVVRFPLFAVADGMGGHAAGEVASTIAVSTLAASAPSTPDPAGLAASIEEANRAVIEGAQSGLGRPGMGTTCTAVVIDGQQMAVGHVGDSRCYLLHAGQLVRVTHDHSYVEELVAAGEITPEEARIHPNRSIITRALGSDPAMKADSFTIDVARGDRVLLCSDGLSSMITDDVIEEAMVTSVAPQACADALVDLALAAGGHDNVTCVVVDVKDDGVASRAFKMRLRNIAIGLAIAVAILLVAWLGLWGIAQRYWYLADEDGYVALYHGIPGLPSALGLNNLEETTSVETDDLSDAVGQRLLDGIMCDSEEEARALIEDYRNQIAEPGALYREVAPASTGSAEGGA